MRSTILHRRPAAMTSAERCTMLGDRLYIMRQLKFARSCIGNVSHLQRLLREISEEGETHFETTACVDILRVLIENRQLEILLESVQAYLLTCVGLWSRRLGKFPPPVDARGRRKKPSSSTWEDGWTSEVLPRKWNGDSDDDDASNDSPPGKAESGNDSSIAPSSSVEIPTVMCEDMCAVAAL